jgi:hypothetical protein
MYLLREQLTACLELSKGEAEVAAAELHVKSCGRQTASRTMEITADGKPAPG